MGCSFSISISLYFGLFVLFFLYSNLLSLIVGNKSVGIFCYFVIWVDILMTTWLFLVALHLWILSVANLKSLSFFAGCIEYLVIFVFKLVLLFFTAL